MDDLTPVRASFEDQAVIFMRKHNWILSWLYLGTFGSFIGFAAGFPLLAETDFAGVDVTAYAFIGPLLGALARPAGGWLADRIGGARVALACFGAMGIVVAVLLFQSGAAGHLGYHAFLALFSLLFIASGAGNGAVFQMIPVVFIADRRRAFAGQADAAQRALTRRHARKRGLARLRVGDRGLRRLFHSQGVRHRRLAHRRDHGGALPLFRLLRLVRAGDLVVLRARRRRIAMLNDRAAAAHPAHALQSSPTPATAPGHPIGHEPAGPPPGPVTACAARVHIRPIRSIA